MFTKLKNHLIHFLIRHTYLDCGVCYEIVKKVSQTEMNVYYKSYKDWKENKDIK